MKKKIREQLRWVITCTVGLFCLWLLPSTVIAASETVYPVTTEYQEVTNKDSNGNTDLTTIQNNFALAGRTTGNTTRYNGYPKWVADAALLTPNVTGGSSYGFAGTIYSKNKVQLDSDFTISGRLAATLKSSASNPDGFGIVFHTGAVNQVGNSGGGLGVTGLPNAYALVFDTYRNSGDPAVPYVGIWETNSNGTLSSTTPYYTTNVPKANSYARIYYTFKYDHTTRVISFEAFADENKTLLITPAGGYKITIPESMREYSFSITAAIGGNAAEQYASIDSGSLPILVTNKPQVTKEFGSTYSTTLNLADTNGTAYPAGSVATVNGTDYTMDDTSSITIPLGTSASETNLTIAVKSFKEYNNQKFDAIVSDSITYTPQQRFWGDVPWTFDSTTGTLTFTSGGTFSTSDDSPWNRTDALKISSTDIKKIVFTTAVKTPANAAFLFGGYINSSTSTNKALSNLTTIEGLTYLDTSNATTMEGMFLNASSLTSLDLTSFNTSQVTNMKYMFAGTSSLTSLDLTNFITSKVTTMYQMFMTASELTNLNLMSFDTSQVTNMNNMFYGVNSLTSLDLSNFNTSKVTDMGSMFANMSSLTSLNISNFDTSTLKPNMSSALVNTTVLKSITLGPKFLDTSNTSKLPSIRTTDEYSGNWQYQKDGSIVGTTNEFLAKYDGKNPGTYVWGAATVTMTVQYLDSTLKDSDETVNKSIFSDAAGVASSTKVDTETRSVPIGEEIETLFTSQEITYYGYDGYLGKEGNALKSTADYTVTDTSTGTTLSTTTVPTSNFTVTFYYEPMTTLVEAPDEFNFGNMDPRNLLAKETFVYPTNSQIKNVKILNTNRNVEWTLSAQLSSAFQRENDGLALEGYLFYLNSNKEKNKILAPSATQLASQNGQFPTQEFVTVLENPLYNTGIGMSVYNTQRNFLGDYTGKIDWLLTTKNI
ncbi:BspA family leucine-rich repeat surface protein [Enterococcus sp. LJL90]